MIKYAIKLHENHKQGHLIFHAVPAEHTNEYIPPSYDDYSWQWYLSNEKNVVGTPIDGHIYESYITTTEQIEYKKIKSINKKNKEVIKLKENHKQGHLIFHAETAKHTNEYIPPSYDDYSWQWYLTNEKDVVGTPIDGHIYESYITTTEQIEYKKI